MKPLTFLLRTCVVAVAPTQIWSRVANLILIFLISWPAPLPAAPQDQQSQNWPWHLHVSKKDALNMPGFGRFEQKRENQFRSEPSAFLGEKGVTTLFFKDEALDAVRVDLYQGEDKQKALECWVKLFGWQRARNGEVITFGADIAKKADDSEVRQKTEAWLAANPTNKVVKLYTHCHETNASRHFITFLVRTPRDYLVYTVYGSP